MQECLTAKIDGTRGALAPESVEGSLESSRLGTVRLSTPGRPGIRLSLLKLEGGDTGRWGMDG
jgi:hypothetical protein